MNTTEVGNALEAAVFDYFEREISGGRFFARPECARVHRQKGYHSRDRQGDIVFDVAVEVYMPGAEDPAMLYLVECKNYGKPVGVGEVEEFFAKVQQVAAANGKAVVVARNSFQQGAIAFARAKGIGLLRYFEPSGFKWELQRSPSTYGAWVPPEHEWAEIERALVHEGYGRSNYDFYGFAGGTHTNSVNAFLVAVAEGVGGGTDPGLSSVIEAVTNAEARVPVTVPFVSEKAIERRAEHVLRGIGYSGGMVDLWAVCEREAQESGLTLRRGVLRSDREAARGVLGSIRFDPLEVVLFETGDGSEPRERFTLAHELGHHFLGHGRYMRAETVDEDDLYRAGGPDFAPEAVRHMEVQANRFASSLLLPREPFAADALACASALGLHDKGHGLIYVDDQECNVRTFYAVTDHLRSAYGVSREAARLRLHRLGLLNDVRGRGTQLGSLLSRQ